MFGVDCAIALTPIRKAIACIVLGYPSAITFFDFALASNEVTTIAVCSIMLIIPDEPVTIAGKDGDDAQRYLEKQVNRVLEKLEEIENQKEIEEEQ
ncbi:hypothetical protein CEN41_07715 [Fischerella thermalis CCMEE 5330]|uniref:Uncharacterized protein n=1 Tax=Fischerella thermalis CCMEE 5330 TaxID=2019670 RepID=A0A2N6MFQ4_9CYAN|nr:MULTISPECIES: hypothetical protein [Fischerella]PMB45597.1 hypothetical protein CEN41_07715 [Fischerella thermalis CCMEE 5330]BAU06381.1 YcfA family protein [Fischerella sp. NIES-3754]BCX08674.1 MAG: hypothetical protein KatS3mg066_2533 [Fischerella sp.]